MARASKRSKSVPLPVPPAQRVLRPGFHARVFALVRQVPPGSLTTYGDVARALGAVQVARHVGNALAALRDDDVPWQRVVNSRGRISFPPGSSSFARQRAALEAEGVPVEDDGRVPLTKRRFRFAEHDSTS